MKPIIDLHQDLLLHTTHPEFFSGHKQTSFEMIQEHNLKIVTVSAFPVPPNDDYFDTSVTQMIEDDLRAYVAYTKTHPEFVIIQTREDVERVLHTDGLYGLVLHIEGLNVFDTESGWDTLSLWHEIGLRSIGPVWNYDNHFGGGDKGSGDKGLTQDGVRLIQWCEKNGVLFDFAHMNEKTFWEASKVVSRPIFVSHGNARALCDVVRNYDDAQLQAIGASHGVIGIFLSKKFLTSSSEVSLETALEHISHIVSVAGKDAVALGSDFGGILSGFAEGLDSVSGLQSFMTKVPPHIQDLFSSKNAERILKTMLQ